MGEMGVGSLACTRAKNVYHKITPPSTEKRGVIVLSQSRPGVRACGQGRLAARRLKHPLYIRWRTMSVARSSEREHGVSSHLQ